MINLDKSTILNLTIKVFILTSLTLLCSAAVLLFIPCNLGHKIILRVKGFQLLL